MKKLSKHTRISKIVKAGALAVAATIVMAGSTFAATGYCNDSNITESDTDVKGWQKCVGAKSKNGKQLWGKTSGDCTKANSYAMNPESCDEGGDLNSIIKNIINAIIGVIGIIAVVMIILGGISYATSQGDPAKVKKGKDTILYGIIGLVVALLAFAIVNFVLGAL